MLDVPWRRFTWLDDPSQTSQVPVACEGPSSNWASVSDQRLSQGAAELDDYIKSRLALVSDDPANDFPSINDVWTAFENRLLVLNSIIYYEPVMRDYIRYQLQLYHT